MIHNIEKNKENVTEVVRTINSFRNITLEGVSKLKIDKVKGKYKIFHKLHYITKQPLCLLDRELIEEEVETLCLELKEVTPIELALARAKGLIYFVLKKDEKLYYTDGIPKKANFISADILGTHVCGQGCGRLSAASDENVGCAKVRNDARYIESFPWITEGYETFNTKTDVFMVAKCTHQTPLKPR